VTAAEYIEIVVLPTLREFMIRPDDRRLAYLSAISTYHLTDYLMRAASPPTRKAADTEMKAVRKRIATRCTDAFVAVESMCHGAKHCGRDVGTPFTPGDETETRRFGFGPGAAGWGDGHWGATRLQIEIDGKKHLVDAIIRAFLIAAIDSHPDQLEGVLPAKV
jgi:hypothetical protein